MNDLELGELTERLYNKYKLPAHVAYSYITDKAAGHYLEIVRAAYEEGRKNAQQGIDTPGVTLGIHACSIQHDNDALASKFRLEFIVPDEDQRAQRLMYEAMTDSVVRFSTVKDAATDPVQPEPPTECERRTFAGEEGTW